MSLNTMYYYYYIKLLECTNVYIVLQNTFVTIEVRDRFVNNVLIDIVTGYIQEF